MQIFFEESGSHDNFISLLHKLKILPKITGLMILAADGNDFDFDSINIELKNMNIPVFGGIYPEVIYNRKNYDKGTVFCALFTSVEATIVDNISSDDTDFDLIFEPDYISHSKHRTMFVFLNGFSCRTNTLIEGLFNIFGLDFNYIGGGAGSLKDPQKPALFTNRGVMYDGVIIISTDLASSVGVSHGWREIAGPFRITNSKHNFIQTIDMEPAFDIYKRLIHNFSNTEITRDNFSEISKAFPFGISRLDSEKIVRDIISVEKDGALQCIGELPTGSYIHLLHGNPNTIFLAAEEAREKSVANCAFDNQQLLFCVDCISRKLFLGDNFQEELDRLSLKETPMIGILSVGEIANNGQDYLEFYNKTSVIAILGE